MLAVSGGKVLVNITPHGWETYSPEARARAIAYISRKSGQHVLRVSATRLHLEVGGLADGESWRKELATLSEFDPEPCPCGCGVDLVMGECREVFSYFTDTERDLIMQEVQNKLGGGARTPGTGGYIRVIKMLRERTRLSLAMAKQKVDELVDAYKEVLDGKIPVGLTPGDYADIESLVLVAGGTAGNLEHGRDVIGGDVEAALVRKAFEVGRREGLGRGFALVYSWYDFLILEYSEKRFTPYPRADKRGRYMGNVRYIEGAPLIREALVKLWPEHAGHTIEIRLDGGHSILWCRECECRQGS